MTLAVGTRLGRYEIVALLGSGGMARSALRDDPRFQALLARAPSARMITLP